MAIGRRRPLSMRLHATVQIWPGEEIGLHGCISIAEPQTAAAFNEPQLPAVSLQRPAIAVLRSFYKRLLDASVA